MSPSITQNSFVGGEWGPGLYKRTDLAKYPTALRTMKNFIIHPHGGASNRGGSEYIGDAKDSSKTARLIPFQFSVVSSYILEMGDLYMRVFRNGGQVVYAPRMQYSIVASGTYKWSASGSGTNEFYLELDAGGDPDFDTPHYVHEDGTSMSTGILGSLSAGEWGYGDNDTLGYDTIYVRLTDNADPDSKADSYLIAAYHTADAIVDSAYKWTASGSGTNEYYLELIGGGDPSVDDPVYVYEDGTVLTEGTLGSLSVSEWGYGDNDSLGYSTIYVRTSGSIDPDSEEMGYLEASSYVEIVTPYAEEDLALLKYTQSADVLYITHPDYAPRKLSRTAHDVWTLSTVSFGSNISAPANFALAGGSGSYYVVTAVSVDGEESVASTEDEGAASNAMTWDAVTGASHYNIYKDPNGNSNHYGWIGQANTNTFTEPSTTITPDFTKTPPSAEDPFDETDDYPGACAFFEQRLVFARTNNDPQKLWGSIVGHYENLNKSTPIQDDDSYSFTLDSRQMNEIRWIVPMDKLLIGTNGAEWRMTSGGQSDVVTPNSVDMKVQSQWGVSDVQPLVIGNAVLFLERSGKAVRDMLYSFEVDGYTGNNLSILSTHLFEGYEVTEWCYQQDPDSIIWCVRNDGTLLGLTYYKEHEVWGWHRHDTDGKYESIASISTSDGDEVWMIVSRTINGSTKRFIERFKNRQPQDGNYEYDVQDSYFVDCGLSLDLPLTITAITKADPIQVTSASHGLSNGDLVDIAEVLGMTELNGLRYKVANVATNTFTLQDEDGNDIDGTTDDYTTYVSGGVARKAVTTITGLDHLEGEAVAVLANGSVIPGKTVSSGSITLTTAASRIHIGLAYTSDLETMGIEYQDEGGTVQDKLRFIRSVLVSMQRSRAFSIGPSSDRLVDVPFRDDENYGAPVELYTGDMEIAIEAGEPREGRIFIRNTDPLPITILSLIARADSGEQ